MRTTEIACTRKMWSSQHVTCVLSLHCYWRDVKLTRKIIYYLALLADDHAQIYSVWWRIY